MITTSRSSSEVSGVTTSEDNYLDAIRSFTANTKAFGNYETDHLTEVHKQVPAEPNTNNNIISFEITQDKRLAYKYINEEKRYTNNRSI